MALEKSRKRKAVTRDALQEDVIAEGDEFKGALLDGVLSQSEDESEPESGLEEHGEDEDGENSGDEYEFDSEDEAIEDLREQLRGMQKNPNARKVNGTSGEHRFNGVDSAQFDDDDSSREDNETSVAQPPDEPSYTVTTDANGNLRYIYQEIDPVYDSDDTDAGENLNTIGNIPLSFYDSYPHIGYDINGKKIMRPARGEALDALLDSIEIPKGWTGLTDPSTGKPLQLSREELEVLKKLTRNEIPEEGYDPYPEMVEWFSSRTEIMPLSAAPEPKRRFVPSKHEAKRVMKIVKAIREGRIQPYKPPEEQKDEAEDFKRYDLWQDEAPRPDHPMHIAAPKLPPPIHEQSYHPPPEYLPDRKERKAWEEADDEDRETEYLPTDHDALRKVPGYDRFLKERFERCLDLYLAPRIRRSKLNIDPESLLPKLPSPDELRPFPTTCAIIFSGHDGRVRSVSVDPSGKYLATGGDDGTVRIWDLADGRQYWHVKLSQEEAVNVVAWRPGTDAIVLAACVGESIYFIVPFDMPSMTPDMEDASLAILDAGWGYATSSDKQVSAVSKEPAAKWARPESKLVDKGVLLVATVRSTVKVLTFHRRGDYFSSVSPRGQSSAIAIHTLSKHLTQLPFRKLKGLAQTAQFHPRKPIFFVATQRTIRSYDLQKQELVKILTPGARWISSMDVHPGGDNLIVGTYDRRLLWHDLDLAATPYKTLRYHSKAIRSVAYHKGEFPLFADASDDGTVQVFHGKVVDDLMENAAIVPLKVLKGHKVKSELGVLEVTWHPKLPWLISCGADGEGRLWN